jgi:site-specific recombinase XerD
MGMDGTFLNSITDEFFNYLATVKNYSVRTLPGYRSTLKYFFQAEKIKIPTDINIQKVEHYLAKRKEAGISQNTNATTMNAIRAFLIFCNKRGYGNFQLELFETPKRKRVPIQFVTEEEVNRMLDVIPRYRDRLLLLVLFTSGARVSELVQMAVENFQENRFTVVAKGDKPHTYLFDPVVADELRGYMQAERIPSGPIFRTTTGKPIGAPAVNHMLKKAAKLAKITHNVSAHVVRRGFGSTMHENGADMRDIQVALGHESILTTQRYVAVTDRRLAESHGKFAPKVSRPFTLQQGYQPQNRSAYLPESDLDYWK